MNRTRFKRKLTLLVAFFICISIGFGLAVVLRERLSSTAEADPCFGHGQVTETWQRQVSQEEIDSIKASAPALASVEPGLREFRRCVSGPGFEVVVDDGGHVWDFTQPSLAQLDSYYKEHPDENPQNIVATSQAKSLQESFVTPEVPLASVAPCDASWTKTTFKGVGVLFCHPPDWVVTEDDSSTAGMHSGNGRVEVGVFSATTAGTAGTRCQTPKTINVGKGDIRVCAFGPGLGQGHGFILPTGREGGVNVYDEATEEERATAFRVAFNIEVLP